MLSGNILLICNGLCASVDVQLYAQITKELANLLAVPVMH